MEPNSEASDAAIGWNSLLAKIIVGDMSEMTYFASSGPSLQLSGTMTAPTFAAAPYNYTYPSDF